MASFWYDEAIRAIMEKEIDLGTGGDTIRTILVGQSTTADTEKDKLTMSAFGTLDEYDNVTGYNLFGETLAGQAVSKPGSNLIILDGTDETWTSLAANSDNCTGAVVYKETSVDTYSTAVPLCFIDVTDFNGNNNNVVFQWNTNGIMNIQA